MKTRRSGIGVVIGLLCAVAGVAGAHAAEEYESEPTLKARDLLSEEERKGPHHEVEGKVEVEGYMAHFVIESEYGDFKAGSEDMARLRIAEIASIAALVEISRGGIFADALAKAAVGKAETAQEGGREPGSRRQGRR